MSIESQVADDIDVDLNRLLVVLESGDGYERYVEGIGTKLEEEFESIGISATVFSPDPLSLDPRAEFAAAVEQQQPDAVLHIRQTQVTENASAFGTSGGSTIMHATLAVPGETRALWKAKINAPYGGLGDGSVHSQFAKKVIKQMSDDGVLKAHDDVPSGT